MSETPPKDAELTCEDRIQGVQRWMALDLWMAVGLHSQDFDDYIDAEGWADTWSTLLGHVRGPYVPCNADMGNGERCVLRPHNSQAHYAAGDVGASRPLPFRGPR